MIIPTLLLLAVAATAFTLGYILTPCAPSDTPRATSIGGIFFKSKDHQALRA